MRQGCSEWLRLAHHFPERYGACEHWEQAQRAQGGARATRSFCAITRQKKKQSLPLSELKKALGEYEQAGLWQNRRDA